MASQVIASAQKVSGDTEILKALGTAEDKTSGAAPPSHGQQPGKDAPSSKGSEKGCPSKIDTTLVEPVKPAGAKVPAQRFPRWAVLSSLVFIAAVIFCADQLLFGKVWPTVPGSGSSCAFDVALVVLCLGGLVIHRYIAMRGQAGGMDKRYASTQRDLVRPPRPACASGVEKDQSQAAQSYSQSHKHVAPHHRAAAAATARWNQAIDAAARQGDVKKAGALLLEFEKSGDQPDVISYNLVIRTCAKKGDWQAAELWLKRMESQGLQATVCSYNTLLDACAKADNVEACEKWLRTMIQRGVDANVISYATAIYAQARRGDTVAAERWLKEMLDAGVEPDAVSYNSLIHACGVQGNAEAADKWIEEMKRRGLEATVTTYTAAIDACAKCGDMQRAEKWMSRMVSEGVEANVVTYSAMIDACAKSGDLARAEKWHNAMTDKGVSPNAHSYSAVINACAKAGDVEAAERWLEKLEQAGVRSDVVVYSSVIDACGKAGDAERAMAVFHRMRASGIRPHIVAYAALARPFAYRGNWAEVECIAAAMKEDHVDPNEYFVYAQLLAYATARPRQNQRAEYCFRDALRRGIKANDHVVGALARSVGRARCGELMKELCNGREVPLPPQRREGGRNAGRGGNTGN